MKIRKLSKVSIVALLLSAALASVAFGLIYMNLTHQYHVSIGTVGNIATYQVGTTIAYSGLTFSMFNATGTQTASWDVVNVGNVPVHVGYTVSASGWQDVSAMEYFPSQSAPALQFFVSYTGHTSWDDNNADVFTLAPGSRMTCTLSMTCDTIATPLTDAPFSVTLYANS